MSEPDLAEIWARSLNDLAETQIEPYQRAWLQLTRPLGLVENTALIATPNEFAKDQLENRLRALITNALSRELGRSISLAVIIDPAVAATLPAADDPHSPPEPLGIRMPFGATADRTGDRGSSPLAGSGLQSLLTPPDDQFDRHGQFDGQRQFDDAPSRFDNAPSQFDRRAPRGQFDAPRRQFDGGPGHLGRLPMPGSPGQLPLQPGPAGLPHLPAKHGPHRAQPTGQADADPGSGAGISVQAGRPGSAHQLGSGGPTPLQGHGAARTTQTRLNPKYTFETFVIGSSNRFAHAAAVAVAEAPAKAYNPLFIYGDSGLGKTHLLHAIGHYAQSLYQGVRVRYVSSEEFTNDFINMIRDGKQDGFRCRYRD